MAPDDPTAHDLVGWAHFLAQEDDEAEVNFNRALELDPTLASAHYHLGRLRSRQGRFAEAALAYRRAQSYDWDEQLVSELERAWTELPQAYHQ
jgi:Flp pilus assembly protein TadD